MAEKESGLAAGDSATGELAATAAGAGKSIDRGPTDTPAVAYPSFAIGSEPGEECELSIATVGLCPKTFSSRFEAPKINRTTYGIDAVRIAIRIHARQQIGTASAFCQARDLRSGVHYDQQRKAHQDQFQGSMHGVSHGLDRFQHHGLWRHGRQGCGSMAYECFFTLGHFAAIGDRAQSAKSTHQYVAPNRKSRITAHLQNDHEPNEVCPPPSRSNQVVPGD